MTNDDAKGKNPDLRPLIARLKEIERKCDSMGTRNEEFPLMKDKLASIISRLEAGAEPSGDPLAYRAMARELFPVAHLFESVGFMSVGKEIAHVERSLQDLEPEPTAPAGGRPPTRPGDTSSAASTFASTTPGEKALDRDDEDDDSGGEGIPKPILAGLFVLVLAIGLAASAIFEVGPFQPKPDPTPVPPTPTAVPTPIPEPTPTPIPRDPDAPPNSRERLAEALSQARLSLRTGDIDEAVNYLSIAALIDRNDTSVLKIADQIVDQRLRDSAIAAAAARWEDAASITAHARTIATRFGLETHRIDVIEHRHSEMERYRMVQPEETNVLRASVGKRVEVKLDSGAVLTGRISAVEGQTLVLDVEDDVGGGVVKFEDKIPLTTIRWVRVWED